MYKCFFENEEIYESYFCGIVGAPISALSHLSEAVLIPKYYLFFLKKKFDKLNNSKDFIFQLNKTFNTHKINFETIFEKSSKICLRGNLNEKTEIITIYLNSNINYETTSLKNIWITIEEILGHELIHRFQFSKRGFQSKIENVNDVRKYLSRKEEIMSFAWQTIFIFMCYNVKREQIIEALKNPFYSGNTLDNSIFRRYYQTFGMSNEKKDLAVWKRYSKYVFEYMNKMVA